MSQTEAQVGEEGHCPGGLGRQGCHRLLVGLRQLLVHGPHCVVSVHRVLYILELAAVSI